jgi:hypothetical protein
MQIKCSFCSMPFALTNEQVTEAVEILKKDPHAHYDAHCPKCRRATKLARKTFELNPVYKKMLEG